MLQINLFVAGSIDLLPDLLLFWTSHPGAFGSYPCNGDVPARGTHHETFVTFHPDCHNPPSVVNKTAKKKPKCHYIWQRCCFSEVRDGRELTGNDTRKEVQWSIVLESHPCSVCTCTQKCVQEGKNNIGFKAKWNNTWQMVRITKNLSWCL